MRTKLRTLIALAVGALASSAALAESSVNTSPGPSTATARLDFQVTIPRVLFLQVGSGAALANGATVDQIAFTVPAANLGDGTVIAGTGGDRTAGAVTVRLLGNDGDIGLTATTTGQLRNAASDAIPWSEISVATAAAATPAAGFLGAAIAHPAIPAAAAGGTGATTTITSTNKVVRQEATWTYTYLNSAAYAPGTYGGTNTNNSRITYTASLP